MTAQPQQLGTLISSYVSGEVFVRHCRYGDGLLNEMNAGGSQSVRMRFRCRCEWITGVVQVRANTFVNYMRLQKFIRASYLQPE